MKKVPRGWRTVDRDERVLQGDEYWNNNKQCFTPCVSSVGYVRQDVWTDSELVVRKEEPLSESQIKEQLQKIAVVTKNRDESAFIGGLMMKYFTPASDFNRGSDGGKVLVLIYNNRVDTATNEYWPGLNGKKQITVNELNKILGIAVEITDEIKTGIINKLKQEKAFNEDSALKVEGAEFYTYLDLAQTGAIKEYDERFFICQ